MPCDYSKYPSNWPEIRKRILERDNHCCKVCKVCKVSNGTIVFRGEWKGIEVFQNGGGEIYRTDNGEYLTTDFYASIAPSTGKIDQSAIKIVLTIAHLNHDVNDNRDENLAALCQLHHLRIDSKQHKANARKTVEKKKGLQSLF